MSGAAASATTWTRATVATALTRTRRTVSQTSGVYANGVFQKRLEKGDLFGQRLLVFSDSQMTIGALARGRPSRPLLNYACAKRRCAPIPLRSGTLSRPPGETPGGMPRAAPLGLVAIRSRPVPTAIPLLPGVRPRSGITLSRWRPPPGRPLQGLSPPSPTPPWGLVPARPDESFQQPLL